ncbi:MAG: TonB-dependent receptor [Alphaproteobacteria bacterium]|nr:TonB-dependent receptor [Alphaproteobacteria bacterium]
MRARQICRDNKQNRLSGTSTLDFFSASSILFHNDASIAPPDSGGRWPLREGEPMKRILRDGASAAAMLLSAGAFWAASAPAYAQTAQVSESETIVVTSTRREAELQDVPIAVTAITEAQIAELAPRTLEDLTGQAPNVFIGMNTAGPGASAIYIRGLGYADIEKTQNPSVGVIVDGVFLGTSTGQLIDAFDIRQVEVNRGPQGIFFGKNTTAGVINVSRSLPTRDYGFRGSASYGTEDEVLLRGIVNLPVGENAGLKLGGTYRERDGFFDNVFTGDSAGERQYTGLTGAFDWDATDWMNVLFSVDVIRAEGGGTPVQFGNVLTANILSGGNPSAVFGPTYNPATGSPAGLGPREIANNFGDADEYDVDLYSLVLTFDTPFGELVSQTAFMDSTDIVFQDFDGTCAGSAGCAPQFFNPLLASTGSTLHTIRDQTYEQLTQEFRLNGTIGQFDYLLGAYYYDHEIGLQQTTNGAVLQLSGEENDSWSLFGNLDWRVTDAVTLSAGVRTIDEGKDFFTSYGLVGAPGVIIPQINDSDDWDDVITRVAASWQVTPNNLLYVSRSEGFRSGGFSIRGTLSEQVEGQTNCVPSDGDATPNEILCPDNNFLSYQPESVTAWEIGTKNAFLDNNVIINLAYFQTEIEDFQINNVVVTPGYGPGTNTYISNLPKVEIEGIEGEVTFRPVLLSDAFEGLSLSAVFGVQEGDISNGQIDGRRAASPAGTAGAPGSTADFTGRPLTRLAEYNLAFRASYEREIGPGVLHLGASYTYIDDFVLGGFGTAQDIEPGYGLLDATVAYEWANYRLSVSGQNIEDTLYRNHSLPTVFFQGYGDPETWSVQLEARF